MGDLMKTLLFLYDYPDINEAIVEKCEAFYKILIAQEGKIRTKGDLTTIYDEIIITEDIYSYENVKGIVNDILKKHEIYRIITSYEKTVEIAGKLRSELEIKGLKERQSLLVRNKYEMKRYLQKQGICVANVQKVRNEQDFKSVNINRKKTYVIKPISGAATYLTFRVNKLSEIESLVKNNSSTEFIIEEFIDGEEYHIDTLIQNGKVILKSVGKYLNNILTCINEKKSIGSILFPPNKIKDSILEEMCDVDNNIIELLGLDNVVCHSEFFITKDNKVVFSEMAARIGGGSLIVPNIERIYGINIFSALIDLELNREINLFKMNSSKFSGFITFESKAGKVSRISKEEDFKNVEGVFKINIAKKIGDNLIDPINSAVRSGFICIEDKEFDSLFKKLEGCVDRFVIEVN